MMKRDKLTRLTLKLAGRARPTEPIDRPFGRSPGTRVVEMFAIRRALKAPTSPYMMRARNRRT